MEDYNKIIESLGVRFITAKDIKILQPLTVENFYDVGNTVMLLNKGELSFGEEKVAVAEGDILFVPGGKMVSISYGKHGNNKLTNEDLLNNRDKFFSSNKVIADVGTLPNSFSYVTFEAKVFDSVNFFASGSPRKRFDRATKSGAESIVAIDSESDSGKATMRVRADESTPLAGQLKSILDKIK